jgi:hypothetical protein
VIDTHGVEIEKRTAGVSGLEYRVPVQGVKPYVIALITVYDGDNGLNSLNDNPTFTSDMRIKRHGNASMDYEKGNYKINLASKTDLLGLDKEDEWILIGTQRDRSKPLKKSH